MAASGDAENSFDRVKAQLKARLGSEVYSSWFGRMKLAETSKGTVTESAAAARPCSSTIGTAIPVDTGDIQRCTTA